MKNQQRQARQKTTNMKQRVCAHKKIGLKTAASNVQKQFFRSVVLKEPLVKTIHLGEGQHKKLILNLQRVSGEISLKVELDKRASFEAFLLIELAKDDKLDFAYAVRHKGEESKSKLKALSILKGYAEKKSTFKMEFEEGAKDAIGSEEETVLALGKEAQNLTIPGIVSKENTAKAKHAFYAGYIAQEQINFLTGIGMEVPAAKRLLIKSKKDAFKQYFQD